MHIIEDAKNHSVIEGFDEACKEEQRHSEEEA
jgi:hypothetical protein